MAVAPLFVTDMTTLKDKLRLGAITSAGGLAAVEQAVLDARIRFYRELTAARVTVLLAITEVDAPTTDNQLLRSLASSTEIQLVRLLLLRRLPVLFKDVMSDRQRIWNEESAFGNPGPDPLRGEIARIEAEIDSAMALLAGDVGVNDADDYNVSTIGPTTTQDLPGASIWPARRWSES